MTTLISAIPALPVRDMARAVAFYKERLGFAAIHVDDGFRHLLADDLEQPAAELIVYDALYASCQARAYVG